MRARIRWTVNVGREGEGSGCDLSASVDPADADKITERVVELITRSAHLQPKPIPAPDGDRRSESGTGA